MLQLKRISVICALTALTMSAAGAQLVWADAGRAVSYQVNGSASPVVSIALQMFSADMQLVTGRPAESSAQAVIQIYELGCNKTAWPLLARMGVPVGQLDGRADAFYIGVHGDHIVVAGSNGRGCTYGLLELSRMAGVSPWVWWGDVVPERRRQLVIDRQYTTLQAPSVEYRGIFINDEDWSLRPWSALTVEPDAKPGQMGPRTYKKLFMLLLRLRANTIWPAMHPGTEAFFAVAGNKEMADSCGIVVGSSHCEPLLRNNVAEWDVTQRGAYNYITNRTEVQHYWAERLEQMRGSEALFTIGMRGIHDGSMEGVKTPEEKLLGLQQVIDDQRQLIGRHYSEDVERVPQVFIPYKEVLGIMESGLRVPADVALVWCDDNYGYMTRLGDAVQQQRQGGAGIYYHLSYWGRPHDHLWLTTTQPGLIYHEMRMAYNRNARRIWIANVHDPKVAAYDLQLFLDMAWDIDCVGPRTLNDHLLHWLTTQFGQEVGRELAPAMREYYRLNAIRRPEFMGWTQVELDKRKFAGGMSQVGQLQLTAAEAADRLEAFGRIKATVDRCRLLLRPELRDAYFAHVVYPVCAAAAMTRKLVSDSAESRQAYAEIQHLTDRYNTLAGGKWRGLMDAAPRRLPVFGNVCGRLAAADTTAAASLIARRASDFTRSSVAVEPVQMLGHSMNAVPLPRGGVLTYEFDCRQEGDATLYTAMIPTQPSDDGDLRYTVQIDDLPPDTISLKEPFRSERWKLNVLRGQALRQTPVSVQKGHHTLRIAALDDHVIVDQWMLDFLPSRSFYVIPAAE